jgi:hypothetical protein
MWHTSNVYDSLDSDAKSAKCSDCSLAAKTYTFDEDVYL